MKRLFTALIVCVIAVVCSLSFAACGETAQNYDDSSLLAKITELENKITNMQKDLNKVKDLEKELNEAKAQLLLLQGKVDGDPNKAYKLGETVSYSSNGLKLFEIKITAISLEGDGQNRTFVDFIFTPYTFIEPSELRSFLSSQIINEDGTSFNNLSSLGGTTFKRFAFADAQLGKKTLYICISSVNMYIPFAVYNLILSN